VTVIIIIITIIIIIINLLAIIVTINIIPREKGWETEISFSPKRRVFGNF